MNIPVARQLSVITILTATCFFWGKGMGCVIVPPPPRPVPSFSMQTRRHEVDIDIRHDYATVTVRATFYNPHSRSMEGEYIFPAGDGVVTSFSMTSDGKTLEAELVPADRAREIYEDIVRRLRDPGLLEYMGMGLIKVRVYPIKARSESTVELVYEQAVNKIGESRFFSYPLRSARPVDASGTIDDIHITVRVHDRDPVATLYSPTHPFDFRRIDEMTVEGVYKTSDVVPSSDVTLCYIKDRKTINATLLAFDPDTRHDGYFRLTLSPSVAPVSYRIIPKDVLFIIDSSGSMAGKKITQAVGALRYALGNLNPRDRYNIITFSSTVRAFNPSVVPVNESNLEHDISRLDDIRARGGTAFYDAVSFSIEQNAANDRLVMGVLLTDGLPTVGNTDISAILDLVESGNEADMRFFVFGVGDDLNTDLLDGLATRSRGTRIYVAESEDIEEKVSILYERISHPVLTDLRLDFGESGAYDLFPLPLPDLFAGEDMVVSGRYKRSRTTVVRLTGRRGDDPFSEEYELECHHDERLSFIPRTWAGAKIMYLLDQIRLNGPSDELVDAVSNLGREFGIVTPYTSFLAFDDDEDQAITHHFDESRRLFEREKVGAGAVRASRMTADMQRSLQSPGTSPRLLIPRSSGESGKTVFRTIQGRIRQRIRTVHDRTFYVDEQGVWVDSGYDERIHGSDTKPLEFLSDEYFDFLRENPEAGRYLAAHSRMLIVLGDRAYMIE